MTREKERVGKKKVIFSRRVHRAVLRSCARDLHAPKINGCRRETTTTTTMTRNCGSRCRRQLMWHFYMCNANDQRLVRKENEPRDVCACALSGRRPIDICGLSSSTPTDVNRSNEFSQFIIDATELVPSNKAGIYKSSTVYLK
ncbi:unnamed protein product [Trichogramma brassicae]|uniref:Uncharacterized protein n=1 Tax=Trichogramma brassicae TaxID=86971 RepID=A0A6H5HVN7_9HYME|nr:unnamed protein product [Trichogramma brassicae]